MTEAGMRDVLRQWLLRRIDAHGKDFAAFSAETGIPKSTLSEIKAARKTVSWGNLAKVCLNVGPKASEMFRQVSELAAEHERERIAAMHVAGAVTIPGGAGWISEERLKATPERRPKAPRAASRPPSPEPQKPRAKSPRRKSRGSGKSSPK